MQDGPFKVPFKLESLSKTPPPSFHVQKDTEAVIALGNFHWCAGVPGVPWRQNDP